MQLWRQLRLGEGVMRGGATHCSFRMLGEDSKLQRADLIPALASSKRSTEGQEAGGQGGERRAGTCGLALNMV